MTTFPNRLYAGAADLQAMIDLLTAVRPAEQITDYPSIVDLRELLGRSTIQANTRLWEDADGQTGLDPLKQRGVDTAILGTSSENVAMQRLAASVGFRVESAKVWFEKQVTECEASEGVKERFVGVHQAAGAQHDS